VEWVFASTGNKKFYVSGVNIEPFNLNKKYKYKNNHRSWGKILKGLKERERKIYCKNLFNSLRNEVKRCSQIHTYCMIRCDSKISRKENLLNFSCHRDCVRTANILDSKRDALAELLMKQDWKPKKGDKCDFLPSGEVNFRMCKITKVEDKGSKANVTLKYTNDGSKYDVVELVWPNENLKQCGTKLTNRSDCLVK